jgi:hypothetical protein
MIVSQKDYVIIPNGKKKVLAKVIHVGEEIHCLVSNRNASNKETQEVLNVSKNDILCNFGKEPERGTSYGVAIEPFYESFIHKVWGEVFVFRDLTDGERATVIKMLDRTAVMIREKKLDGYLPITIEIRPPKGSQVGMYKFDPKGTDCMIIKPVDWQKSDYVPLHEHGHNLWYRAMSTKQKARWIKKYKHSIDLSNVAVSDISSLRHLIVSSKDPLRAILHDCDEDKQPILTACLDYVWANYHLSSDHLDTLRDNGDNLKSIWPKKPLDLSDIKPLVSEYGMKSPEELWAESYCFYMMGEKLPKSITKLVVKTLNKIH